MRVSPVEVTLRAGGVKSHPKGLHSRLPGGAGTCSPFLWGPRLLPLLSHLARTQDLFLGPRLGICPDLSPPLGSMTDDSLSTWARTPLTLGDLVFTVLYSAYFNQKVFGVGPPNLFPDSEPRLSLRLCRLNASPTLSLLSLPF